MSPNSRNGKGPIAVIERKIADYKHRIAGLEMALAELDVHQQESSTRRAGQTFAAALRNERNRLDTKPYASPDERAKRPEMIRAYLRAHPLCRMKELLAHLRQQGVMLSIARISQIVNVEMPDVERVGSGQDSRYRLKPTANVSTKKTTKKASTTHAPLSVNQPGYFTRAETRRRRQRTAVLLNKFSTTDARTVPGSAGISPLIKAGYLRREGDGYVRTDKAFDVNAF